jgi:hypothetical protein
MDAAVRSLVVVVAVAALPFVGGCSSSSEQCAGKPYPAIAAQWVKPPADPRAAAPTGSGVTVFAMRKLLLADTNMQMVATADAWKEYGLNIDGNDTTCGGTVPACRNAVRLPQQGEDAPGGVDNAFGQLDIPELQGIVATPTATASANVENYGGTTNLLVVTGLDGATSASGLSASLLVAGPLGRKPKWDGSDVWPVDSSSVQGNAATAPQLSFSSSYVSDGVFVAAPPSGDGEIALGAFGVPLVIPIRHVQVVMKLSQDGAVAQGIVSGVVPLAALLSTAQEFLAAQGGKYESFCGDAAFASIAQYIAGSADILLDGTQDSTKDCDGVSFGMGFEADRVQLGSVVAVTPLPSCSDAGAGGARDAGGG